jgi:hypothetical protein
MISFKKLKDQLMKQYIVEDGGEDLAELAAFDHGLDVMYTYQSNRVQELTERNEYLAAENKKLKRKL